MTMYGILPQEFRFSHRFAFHLHDVLARMVHDGERDGIFDVQIDFASETERASLASVPDEETWDWLESNGREAELCELTAKQVFAGLVADMCQFTFEALSCARKGKLAVAYALFRKPLKDNLFYLEWLLADQETFVERFRRRRIENVDHTKAFPDPKEKRRIMQAAMAKTPWGNWLTDELLYDLRYAKSAAYGFEGYWNQATHLITTHRHYRTDDTNFNFVFSGGEDHIAQWRHLYLRLPVLMVHAVEIADSLFASFSFADDHTAEVRRLRRAVGFQLWADQAQQSVVPDSCLERLRQYITEVGTLCCTECGNQVALDLWVAMRFYLRGVIRCPACGSASDIEDEGVHLVAKAAPGADE